jgi:beta-glucosidase
MKIHQLNWIGTPAENPTSVTYEEGVYWLPLFQYVLHKPSYEFGYGLSPSFDYQILN